MILKLFKSKELQLKLIIAMILAISLVISIFYHQVSVKELVNNESKLLLFQTGKTYENQINSELSKFTALAEILTSSFSKNINNPNFKSDTKSILKKMLSDNERLISISLVLNNEKSEKDSLSHLFSFKDSLIGQIINLSKSKSGIYDDFSTQEFSSMGSEFASKNALGIEHAKILNPEVKHISGNTTSLIPIVSTLYFGKQNIGYLILYVSIDWIEETVNKDFNFQDKLETFFSNGKGQVFAMNKNTYLLMEPISKICFSCEDLLLEKGSVFNFSIENENLTICFPIELSNTVEKWHICLRCEEEFLYKSLGYNKWYPWLIGIILYLIGIIVIFIFLRKRELFWPELFSIANSIPQGNIDLNDYKLSDENSSNQSKLRLLLLNIAAVTKKLVALNNQTISGIIVQKDSEELMPNEILKSTKKIHDTILVTKDKLEKVQAELNQNNEFNQGQEKISEVLQLHYRDLLALSENVISNMVDLLKISMGAVYLTNNQNHETFLELAVSYAYSENRYQKRRFKFGESLVGACAAEQRTIHLKKIPENYLSIMSGLGLASPKSVLIVPLLFESKVLGVIELGSLGDFDEYQIRFTETAAANIANTLSLSQNNIINSELLEKTRLQTLELEDRDKSTNEAMNQLKMLHEKTAESEAAFRSKLEAMNNTLIMVEYTTQGVLIDANHKFLQAMHYSIEEIRGNNVFDLLKDDEREELVKIIDNVKIGNFFEGLIHRHTKLGHEKWFLATYTPVYNSEGNVDNILFFAVDITRMRVKEEQLSIKVDELSKQVSELRNLISHK